MTEMKNNKKKTGASFFSKSLLMILSLIIALVLWFIGTMQDQTPISRVYSDIPVKFINENVLSDLSLTAEDLSDIKVNAVLKGYLSDMKAINEDELVAVIDLSAPKIAGEYTIAPSVTGCSKNITVTRIDSVEVTVEKLITKQLNIEIETKGTAASGFYVDLANIQYIKTVEAICGETISKNVAGAKVIIDVTDRSDSFTVNLNIILLDPQGKQIDASKIKLQYDSINVSVPVTAFLTQ